MEALRLVATAALVLSVSGSAAAQSGTLNVQLVEPGWLPVPEIAVTLAPVATCETGPTRRDPGSKHGAAPATGGQTKETDHAGVAAFTIPGKGLYRVAIEAQDGFAARMRCVRLLDFAPPFGTAYVQIQLAPAGRALVIK